MALRFLKQSSDVVAPALRRVNKRKNITYFWMWCYETIYIIFLKMFYVLELLLRVRAPTQKPYSEESRVSPKSTIWRKAHSYNVAGRWNWFRADELRP